MADKSLNVSVTANVTSLQAQSAVAKAELTSLNATVRSLATQFASASDEMKGSLAPQLEAAAAKATAMKAELAALNNEMRKPPEDEVGLFGRLAEGMESATSRVEGLTDKMQGFSRLTAAVSEFVLAGLAIEKVADAFKETAEMGEKLNQLSQKTGIAVTALSGLRVVSVETGTDFETVETALAKLGNTMQEATETPTSKAAAAFRAMGISVTDAAGQLRPMQDVLQEVSEKIAEYQDGTAKAALVSDVFGARAGDTLIPMLNELGEKGFQGASERAKELGVSMDGTSSKADEEFNAAMHDSSLMLEGVRDTITQAAIPALTVLEQAFTSGAQGSSTLNAAELVLADTFKGGIEVFTAVATALSEISDAALLVGQELGEVATISVAAGEAMAGNFGKAEALVGAATKGMADDWNNAIARMKTSEQTFADTHNALWHGVSETSSDAMNGLGDHQGGEDKPQAPTIDKAALDAGKSSDDSKKQASEQTQIAQDAANAQKQIQESQYQQQVSLWDAAVTQGKMSKAQEIQDEIDAQQKMYEVQLAEAEKEAQLTSLTPVQKAKALNDIEVMQAQHNAQMARMSTELLQQQKNDADKAAEQQKQAAEKTQQAWERAFQPITQAFDSSINGVLQGTETLQQAEAKAAQSITLAFIDAEAKKLMAAVASNAQILARHMATEMGMTAATEAGETARLASKTAGDAQGKAVSLSSGIAQINNDAMKAAAGAYASTAEIPLVGPVLAPAAAAAAYTAVMGFEVLSAEGGTVIPSGVNPLIQAHEKEMVLPANIAQPLLGMVSGGADFGSGGGDSYHFHNENNLTQKGGKSGVSVDDVFSAMNEGVRSGLHASSKYPALARAFRRG